MNSKDTVMGTEKHNIQKFFDQGNIVNQFKMHKDYNMFSRRRAIFDFLKDTHFRKVVDLGCGSGGYLGIKKQYNCVYFGLDFSENMIKIAKKRAVELGIKEGVFFQQGDTEETPYDDNSFDLVLSIGLIEYFENPHRLIEEIKRILEPGGTLIIQSSTPNPYIHAVKFMTRPISDLLRFVRGRDKRIAHKRYTKEQLDDLLNRNGFQIVDFAYSNFHLLPITPFSRFLSNTHAYFSEILARKDPKRFDFFAANYIAKYHFTK